MRAPFPSDSIRSYVRVRKSPNLGARHMRWASTTWGFVAERAHTTFAPWRKPWAAILNPGNTAPICPSTHFSAPTRKFAKYKQNIAPSSRRVPHRPRHENSRATAVLERRRIAAAIEEGLRCGSTADSGERDVGPRVGASHHSMRPVDPWRGTSPQVRLTTGCWHPGLPRARRLGYCRGHSYP